MKTLLHSTLYTAAALMFLAPLAEADYWISSTGKTHNSSCRYYQKGKGKLSATPTGKDCKVCKGAANAQPAAPAAPAVPEQKPEPTPAQPAA